MAAWLALVPAISALLDKIIPDEGAREKAKLELLKSENEAVLEELRLSVASDQMQADVNKVEAASANIFVAGWRPAIGWTCGIAFFYHFVLQPFLLFACAAFGHKIDLPAFDMEALNTVLMGMLGLGGLRTLEKVKSANK